jgi:hypothetical protein
MVEDAYEGRCCLPSPTPTLTVTHVIGQCCWRPKGRHDLHLGQLLRANSAASLTPPMADDLALAW